MTILVLGLTAVGGIMFKRECPNDDWKETQAKRKVKRKGARTKDSDLEELQHDEAH